MHVLFKRMHVRTLNIPTDLQLYLFYHVILPIAVYGCEISGFENSQIIENLHNDFLRHIVSLDVYVTRFTKPHNQIVCKTYLWSF